MFEKLGRFEIKGILGRGAMGEVYLGVDPSIGREVAIKTILATSAPDEDARQRFAREARAAGVLNHPNIVTIYEFGEDQGVLFIAMERVKGQDLDELLRQRSLAPGEVLEVLAQVCDGLGYAHRNHIIHRDIKPSNVHVLRDGRRIQAKVMDFGVARLRDSEMTATGTVVGTVSYMAPEYIRTGKPDGRSDLFAVGVMLYECISGRRPFEGDTTPTILYRIVNEPPDPVDLSQLREISPAIRSVLDRALAKNPDERYQAAEDLAQALRAAKDPTWQGQPREATIRLEARTQAGPLPPPIAPAAPTAGLPIPKPTRSRLPLVAALLGMAGLGIMVGGGYTFYRLARAGKVLALRTAPAQAPAGPAAPEAPAQPEAAPVPPSPEPSPVPAEPAAALPLPSTPLPAPPQPRSLPKLPPPTVTPAPEPPPAPSTPEPAIPQTSDPKNYANVAMSEAIRLVDADPDKAIDGLRKAIAADPGNAGAYAWLVVTLYEQGRYQEIPAVLGRARQHGIARARLMTNLRFRMAMQSERQNHRIPGGIGGEE